MINKEDLKELALKYLDKYQPSKKDLRIYLFKKSREIPLDNKDKTKTLEEIDDVILSLEKLGLIDDKIYSEIKSKNFLKRGYSINKIRSVLMKKGVNDNLLHRTIEGILKDNEDPDFYSAIKLCKRRVIGPYRSEANRKIFYIKDTGVLARSGFSYEISKRVLDLGQKELKIFEKKF
ncbi:MAG: regulatory protein RecX [Candidatus Fonsibacter sp.]